MEPQSKTSAKDIFINLGAIVALYTTVVSLVNLLFTIINNAYPQINNGYSFLGSTSISWPVATIIIFFPIYILLMWLLEKDYKVNPDKQNSGIHKWLTYITLFLAGITLAIDLITILYYFIDGQEVTTAFLLKVLALFIIVGLIFYYYLADARNKLTAKSRNMFRIIALVIAIAAIVWGFAVLGSPRSQRLMKYDEQKVNDLTNIKGSLESYYATHGSLPASLQEATASDYYVPAVDPQSNLPYEYTKTGAQTYDVCAEFNTATPPATKPNIYMRPIGYESWTHPAGHYCFSETINPNLYAKPIPKY
ncbi:MAG: DUF5671 domain-containing protein [Patescibacteria group bacterium]